MKWNWERVFWMGAGAHVALGVAGLAFWPDAPNLQSNAIGAAIGLAGVVFERLTD